MTKETLNAQEIEHLRDHGTLPPAEVETTVVITPVEAKQEATPTVETAGNASINEEVVNNPVDPTVEDLPKEGLPDRPQGIDEDRLK